VDKKALFESIGRLNAASTPANVALAAAREAFKHRDYLTAEREAIRSLAVSPTIRDREHPNGQPLIPEGYKILGLIRLEQGRPVEAKNFLLATGSNYASESRDLALVIAYCRLGDYKNASLTWQATYQLHRRDLFLRGPDIDRPAGRNVRELEALSLFVRAVMTYGNGGDRGQADLLAAERLLPRNPMIAFELGKVLADNNHYDEAVPRFNTVIANGHGDRPAEARKRVEQIAETVKWQKAEAEKKRVTDQQP
jgi:tetratricopeptide (TPR) repeat protein